MRGIFKGSIVALATPFRGAEIDFPSFAGEIELQIDAGSDALVVAGTTGEAATLTSNERHGLFAYAVGVARGRIPILAGVGTNATRSSCEHARAAQAAGADGVLVVTPYYNRPSQAGLSLHFESVASAVRLPVVLYNVPARTSIDLAPETALALARKCSNIVAIKEASTPQRVAELSAHDALDVLCGEDSWIVDGMHAGACGVIGVVANLVPEQVAELVRGAASGDDARAAEINERLQPLVRALFLETNPAPLKHALHRLGRAQNELRPPLTPVGPETERAIAEGLEQIQG